MTSILLYNGKFKKDQILYGPSLSSCFAKKILYGLKPTKMRIESKLFHFSGIKIDIFFVYIKIIWFEHRNNYRECFKE